MTFNSGQFRKGRRKYRQDNPNWKGGRRITSSGYVLILTPGHPYADRKGYVVEHRLVMEQHIDRYLTDNEEVHHKNHDRTDNRIANLKLMTKGQHTRLHNLERPIEKRLYWGKNNHLKVTIF